MTSHPIPARAAQPNEREYMLTAHATLIDQDPGINLDIVAMSDAEVADLAYAMQTAIADARADFEAVIARHKAREEDARAVIAWRMQQYGATMFPHARLDVRITSTKRRVPDLDKLLAIKREHPEVDWSGAIDEVEIPASVEAKTNLTGLNKLAKALGNSPIAKRIESAIPTVYSNPLMKITMRDDALTKVGE